MPQACFKHYGWKPRLPWDGAGMLLCMGDAVLPAEINRRRAADVKIELHGPAGRSGTVALQDTAIVTPFRRGRCDDFRFRCLSVAPIQALSVICETPEDHEKAWFLDWVAIRPGPQAPWVYFSFNCWIPSNRALTRCAALPRDPRQVDGK